MSGMPFSRGIAALVAGILAGFMCSAASATPEATVLNRAQIDRVLSSLGPRPPTNREVIHGEHYSVKVAMLDHRSGPAEFNGQEDRVFIVLDGVGAVCVADRTAEKAAKGTKTLAGCKALPMRAGSVITVPRGTSYQMQAPRSKVEFLVVRVIS